MSADASAARGSGSGDLAGRVVGRYEILHEIGRGGMAAVYLARARGIAGFERLVALKCCAPAMQSDPHAVQMFLDEARLAAKIHHPNVAATLDVGNEALLYLVMEYIEGDKLSTLITTANKRDERLPIPVVLRIVADALTGLHAAHELHDSRGRPLNLIHRDVSPQNIMVGVDGITRIVDFGIAKAEASVGITRNGVVKGKLGYISPERLSTRQSSRQCDVFAAGVVLWESLAGERLFADRDGDDGIDRLLRGDVPPPSGSRADVPTDLDGIVWRAVAREPRDRFATAADFAEAIERCSVRPATVREVAAYVDTLLGATLQARRARLAGYATASLPLPPAEADAAPSTGEQDTLTATSPVDPAERHEAAMSPAHDLGAYPDTTVEPTTPFVATAAAALRPRSRRAHWILGAAALAVASVLIANTIRSRSARHEPGVAVRTGTPPTVVAPVPAATAPIAVAPTAPAPERREPSPLPTAPTITHTPPSYSHHESIRRTPHAPAARPPSTAPPTPPPQQEFHPRVL